MFDADFFAVAEEPTRLFAFNPDKGDPLFDRLVDSGDHALWRRFAAERIALELDRERFGVKEIHLIGSTESGDAGLGSDIDLVIHIEDDADKRRLLETWLEAWSKALAMMNYLRTGYMAKDLLDIHLVTDREVRANDSFAVKMRNPAESSRLACHG